MTTPKPCTMPEEKKYVHLGWGTEIEVTHIGIWGHDAYTDKYTYSGAMGHYPNTKYRFTRFGECSIADKEYMDVFFNATDCVEGYSNGVYKIKSIRADLVEKMEEKKHVD